MAFDQVMSTTMKFPMGYRFVPTEEELVLGYLLKKVKGETLPSQAVIDCEIYGDDKEPWKIFNQTSTDKFYVFTKLKKKNGRGRRIDRTAGYGTWKAQNTYLVMDSKNNHVGFNKLFVFEVKGSDSNNAINGHWLMHEFSLLNDKSDFVLCEIRNKNATGVIQTEKEDCEKGSIVEELESCEDGILTVEELEDMMIGAEESFQSEKEDCSKGSTVIKLASCEVWMDTRGT
ncbi:PREDICTED: NAC domain-containing protein 19 [Theobroma cacao]|uniref:NAC domain-containing protein 19 n=1 Tax=Theobroma cacao TaxID=3641 RepID=A0AB32WAW8_THECC|nr:PREDICTED: NAC domain-containing protein 19 [Theobroma cacao]